MKIKLDESYSNKEAVLCCPNCGDCYTHHGVVEVFCRDYDDSETGKHVSVAMNGWVDTDNNMTNNPSARRNGILINLCCENCGSDTVLTISQHKGHTLVSSGIVKKSIVYDAAQ